MGACVVGALEDLLGATESPLKGGVIPTRLSVLVAVQQLPGLVGDPCRGRTVDRQVCTGVAVSFEVVGVRVSAFVVRSLTPGLIETGRGEK